MKVKIGERTKGTDGWQTVDVMGDPDWKVQMWDLPFADQSVEVLHAYHVLEHVAPGQLDRTLAEWHRILAVGGSCLIEVPDLSYACALIIKGEEWTQAHHMIYGSGEDEGMIHHHGFTFTRLSMDLTRAGFEAPHIESVWSCGGAAIRAEVTRG